MRVGEGAGKFIYDLHSGVSDEEMRTRWTAGEYGKLREQDVNGWRELAGRSTTPNRHRSRER